MKQWDAFISHASEDSATVARPLTEALRRLGLEVWLDAAELKIGDSLSEKIDEALADSLYGVLIVSPSFIEKQWPRRELNGLMAKEDLGRKVILPVWHNVTKEQLVGYSPMLADRLASETRSGIEAVARDIAGVVLDPGNTTMPVERRGPRSRFALLLNSRATAETLKQFLRLNRGFSCAAFRVVDGASTDLRWDVQLGPHHVDVAIGQYGASIGEWQWTLVDLLEPSEPLANDTSSGRSVAATREKFGQLRTWVGAHLGEAQSTLPDVRTDFGASVIAGRRDCLTDADRKMLPTKWDSSDERLEKTRNGRVHTYDSLWEHGVG